MTPKPPIDLAALRALTREGQERPWSVRVDVSGFVSILDANGMFVADFGSGSPTEAELTVAIVNVLPAILSHIDSLATAIAEAAEKGVAAERLLAEREMEEVRAARDEACRMIQQLVDAQARYSSVAVASSQEFAAMKRELDRRIAQLRKVGAK